jgi:hypothetical protein
MFEDLKESKELYMSDKDIIEGLGVYIEGQNKKYIHICKKLYKQDQLLLKAKEEIEMLQKLTVEQNNMLMKAKDRLRCYKENNDVKYTTNIPDVYYKDFGKGFCDINFEDRTMEWSGEATLNELVKFEDELVKIFGKDKMKEISDDFKIINNNWKTIQ